MKTFGDHLRRAREAKGVTIDSIADATRISKRYLHALERSDLGALPGGAFDKGYIKTYAELLEIDPGPVLVAYAEEAARHGRGTEESERRMLEEMAELADRRAARRSRRASKALILIPCVLALAAGAFWLAHRPKTETEPAPEPEVREPVVVRKLERQPEAPPEPDAPNEFDDIRVTESGVGTSIVERNLAGRGTHFLEGSEVWYWTRVVGGGEGGRIRHVWIHDGRTAMLAELPVEGVHWRTYSTFTLPPGSTGEWVVEARTSEGKVLARDAFVCLSSRDGT